MLRLPSLGELDRRPLRGGLVVSRRHSALPGNCHFVRPRRTYRVVLIGCQYKGLRLLYDLQ
jgi:hypothetical protein